MNQMTPPPRLEIVPPTAPFTEEQRSWLNGFLVGMLSLDGSTPLSPELNGAVMAPQDCGQCGYNCNDYSEAIAGKTEPRLNLCVPGGKETARMLKALHEELEKAPPAASGAAAAPAV